MSGLKDKTPSESFRDLLVIGSNYEGLTSTTSPITDGFNNSSTISSCLNATDIDFNGGTLGSFYFNNFSASFSIHRIEYSSINYMVVGNPGVQFWMSMFYSSPDPGPTVPCSQGGSINNCRRIVVLLKHPEIIDSLSNSSIYAFTDMYISADGTAVRYDFLAHASGIKVNGIESFSHSDDSDGHINGDTDYIKVEFIQSSVSGYKEFYVSLVKKDCFSGMGGGDMPSGKLKEDCEDSWNLYDTYERKGDSIKAAIPLAKATPAGSYKDILCLNNDNDGLSASLSEVTDGDGSNSGIQLSLTQASIDTNGGYINDPIFGSTASLLYPLEIVDGTASYSISGSNIDNILISRNTASLVEQSFYVDVNAGSVPRTESTDENIKNMMEVSFSYSTTSTSSSLVKIRFLMNEIYSDYYELVIPPGANIKAKAKVLLIIYSDIIEEIIEITNAEP